MDMKGHILAALREHFAEWEELLAEMSEEQLATPQRPDEWPVKDVLAHVSCWLQVSIARMEAGALNRELVFPEAPAQFDLDTENDVDGINAWFYETYRTWRVGQPNAPAGD